MYNNYFLFYKINYIHKQGNNLGKNVAPTYATLNLTYSEKILNENKGHKYVKHIKEILQDQGKDT